MKAHSSAPALVLVGGPKPLVEQAQRFAALNGWERILRLSAPPAPFHGEWKTWVDAWSNAILARTGEGATIVVLAPEEYYRGWERGVRRRGRHVETPFGDLSLAGMMIKLEAQNAALQHSVCSWVSLRTRLERLFGREGHLDAPRRSA
jgi:hypothetical protein